MPVLWSLALALLVVSPLRAQSPTPDNANDEAPSTTPDTNDNAGPNPNPSADSNGGPSAGADPSASTQRQSGGSHLIPPRVDFGGVFYLPTVHYREETGVGFGGEVLYPFLWPGSSSSTPPSDILVKGHVTTKMQTRLEVSATLNWREGRWYLKSKLSHTNLAQGFYGIGANTRESDREDYRPRRLLGYVELFRRFAQHFKAGLRLEAEYFDFLEVEPGGKLDSPQARAVSDQTIVGSGVVMDWDTRDVRYNPSSGSHHQFFALVFDDKLGGDINFKNYHLDLRRYFSLAPRHVLATQVFVFGVTDRPPFWRFASIGGRAHTRGYRRDRFLDEVMLAFQGEYRVRAWWRIGVHPFLGYATVAPELGKLQLDQLKPTIGIGFDLHYAKRNRIIARFDTALGLEGLEFDLSLRQSF